MQTIRNGRGRPLVLVHGLGSDSGLWRPVWDRLSAEREVIAVDLTGHGDTPPLEINTIATFADALETFLADSGLTDADLVGSSVGARLVLELARRGSGGAVVALDPGGFWDDAGARYIGWTLSASVRAVRALDRLLPTLTANPVTRQPCWCNCRPARGA
jgi:pimeloyl-ACP methyl ester carboxylesterase